MSTLASQLFAKVHSRECKGTRECHWCGGSCTDKWVHDDVAPIPFERSKTTAKRPGNSYICEGCMLYHKNSVTVRYLIGGLKDRQCFSNWSWFMTLDGIWVIKPLDHQELYNKLLAPPPVFCLTLTDGTIKPLIQLCLVNEVKEMKADTLLKFTFNNIPHTYTIYELEQAIKTGSDGKMPGASALIRYLGKCERLAPPVIEEKKERGRPIKKDDSPYRKIKTS